MRSGGNCFWGVEVTPYAVEYDTLLMTVQRGWNGDELRDFLLSKEEVIEVEWDQSSINLSV